MERAWAPPESRSSIRDMREVLLGTLGSPTSIACIDKWGRAEAVAWLARHGVPGDHELLQAATDGPSLMRKLLGEKDWEGRQGREAPNRVREAAANDSSSSLPRSSVDAPKDLNAIEVVNPLMLLQNCSAAQGESKTAAARAVAVAVAGHAAVDLDQLRQEMCGLRALCDWARDIDGQSVNRKCSRRVANPARSPWSFSPSPTSR